MEIPLTRQYITGGDARVISQVSGVGSPRVATACACRPPRRFYTGGR